MFCDVLLYFLERLESGIVNIVHIKNVYFRLSLEKICGHMSSQKQHFGVIPENRAEIGSLQRFFVFCLPHKKIETFFDVIKHFKWLVLKKFNLLSIILREKFLLSLTIHILFC